MLSKRLSTLDEHVAIIFLDTIAYYNNSTTY